MKKFFKELKQHWDDADAIQKIFIIFIAPIALMLILLVWCCFIGLLLLPFAGNYEYISKALDEMHCELKHDRS